MAVNLQSFRLREHCMSTLCSVQYTVQCTEDCTVLYTLWTWRALRLRRQAYNSSFSADGSAMRAVSRNISDFRDFSSSSATFPSVISPSWPSTVALLTEERELTEGGEGKEGPRSTSREILIFEDVIFTYETSWFNVCLFYAHFKTTFRCFSHILQNLQETVIYNFSSTVDTGQ